MNKWIRLFLIIASVISVFIILPILIMSNCSGWNEGSMLVQSCYIDNSLTRSLAELVYGLVFMAVLMIGIPLLVYLLLVILAIYFIYKMTGHISEQKISSMEAILFLILSICSIGGVLSFYLIMN